MINNIICVLLVLLVSDGNEIVNVLFSVLLLVKFKIIILCICKCNDISELNVLIINLKAVLLD